MAHLYYRKFTLKDENYPIFGSLVYCLALLFLKQWLLLIASILSNFVKMKVGRYKINLFVVLNVIVATVCFLKPEVLPIFFIALLIAWLTYKPIKGKVINIRPIGWLVGILAVPFCDDLTPAMLLIPFLAFSLVATIKFVRSYDFGTIGEKGIMGTATADSGVTFASWFLISIIAHVI